MPTQENLQYLHTMTQWYKTKALIYHRFNEARVIRNLIWSLEKTCSLGLSKTLYDELQSTVLPTLEQEDPKIARSVAGAFETKVILERYKMKLEKPQ